MTNLLGNPHAYDANYAMYSAVFSSDESGTQVIESLLMDNAKATLVLAYEQGAANLITLAQLTNPNLSPDYDMETIHNRLGLGGNSA